MKYQSNQLIFVVQSHSWMPLLPFLMVKMVKSLGFAEHHRTIHNPRWFLPLKKIFIPNISSTSNFGYFQEISTRFPSQGSSSMFRGVFNASTPKIIHPPSDVPFDPIVGGSLKKPSILMVISCYFIRPPMMISSTLWRFHHDYPWLMVPPRLFVLICFHKWWFLRVDGTPRWKPPATVGTVCAAGPKVTVALSLVRPQEKLEHRWMDCHQREKPSETQTETPTKTHTENVGWMGIIADLW